MAIYIYEVANAFAQLEEGYEVWVMTAIHAFETLDDANHLLQVDGVDRRIHCNSSWTEALKPFAPNGPCDMTINLQSSQYPQEAHLIKTFFLPMTAAQTAAPGVIIVSLPGEAKKNEEMIKGITKLHLLYIAGTLDPGTGLTAGEVTSTTSVGIVLVIASAHLARPQAYANLLWKACSLAATLWPCNIRSMQMSLKVIQKAVATALLGGNFTI